MPIVLASTVPRILYILIALLCYAVIFCPALRTVRKLIGRITAGPRVARGPDLAHLQGHYLEWRGIALA